MIHRNAIPLKKNFFLAFIFVPSHWTWEKEQEPVYILVWTNIAQYCEYELATTVKLGNKERFGIEEPFPVTNCRLLHKIQIPGINMQNGRQVI